MPAGRADRGDRVDAGGPERQTFMCLGRVMGPPPGGVQPPILWGAEDHVGELFAGHQIQTERRMLVIEHESMEVWQRRPRTRSARWCAKAALEPQGRWEAVRDQIAAIYEDANEAEDGGVRVRSEYLLTTVTVS